jgi:hypothetical protein
MTHLEDPNRAKRLQMIAEAAYFRAVKYGFSGDVLRDWREAVTEINAQLRQTDSRDAGRKLQGAYNRRVIANSGKHV